MSWGWNRIFSGFLSTVHVSSAKVRVGTSSLVCVKDLIRSGWASYFLVTGAYTRACREGSSEGSGGSSPGQAVPLTSALCLCSQPLPASRLGWRICPYFHKIQPVPLCKLSAALMGQNMLFAPASQAGLCPTQYTNACFCFFFLPATPECLPYQLDKHMLVKQTSFLMEVKCFFFLPSVCSKEICCSLKTACPWLFCFQTGMCEGVLVFAGSSRRVFSKSCCGCRSGRGMLGLFLQLVCKAPGAGPGA